VFSVAQRISVPIDGALLAEGTPAEIELAIGRAIAAASSSSSRARR